MPNVESTEIVVQPDEVFINIDFIQLKITNPPKMCPGKVYLGKIFEYWLMHFPN